MWADPGRWDHRPVMVMRVVAVAGALGVAGACVGNASGIGVVLTVALPVYLAGLGCPRRSTNVLKHAAAGQAAVRHAHDGPWLRVGSPTTASVSPPRTPG